MKAIAQVWIIGLLASNTMLAQSPDIILGRLLGNSKLMEARDFIAADHGRIVPDGVSSADEDSASRWKKLMESSGLKDVSIDEHGNLSAVRKGVQDGPFVAVMSKLDSPQAVTSMMAIARALEAAGITTRTGLLFVAINNPEKGGDEKGSLRSFLDRGPYHGRIRACLVMQATPENTVIGPPNSIGSTIVQYGLQSVAAYGVEPNFASASGVLEVPIELRIPAVGMGLGEGAASVRGIQMVMTAALAIAGV